MLSQKTLEWLRQKIPVFAEMQDRVFVSSPMPTKYSKEDKSEPGKV